MGLGGCKVVLIVTSILVKRSLCHCNLFYAANIFGIGDCTNVPTSRTAAACAAESAVIRKNLLSVMRGETPKAHVSVGVFLIGPVFMVRPHHIICLFHGRVR
jgi:NADPH-dependent 2,4-dienoyl-CoA reductase/sulfur reductase-like enzyme